MVAITHTFVSAKGDGGDASFVQPSNWNANHTIVTSATDVLIGRQTAGAGAAEEIPCTAFGRSLLALASSTALSATYGIAVSGAIQLSFNTGAQSGWVRANGQTIGDATSGATERANADTSALYTILWNGFTNTICPVSGGRGASAAADFAAHKTITLPDVRGRGLFGLDDMGASAAGRISATTATPNGTTMGASGGEQTHLLTTAEIPSHNHGVTDPGHTHTFTAPAQGGSLSFAAGTSAYFPIQNTGAAVTGISIQNTGGGGAHNSMSPFILCTIYIKL